MAKPSAGVLAPSAASATGISLRSPRVEDGPAVTALISACPPLDPNSAYCNLLQCSHFADTCVLAERAGRLLGWISGYRLPADSTRFFVWQVAVHPDARGEGLARRMLEELLARPAAAGVTHMLTTITRANEASWALFRGFAGKRHASLAESPMFERDRHFAGSHDTEWQVEIGPFQKDEK